MSLGFLLSLFKRIFKSNLNYLTNRIPLTLNIRSNLSIFKWFRLRVCLFVLGTLSLSLSLFIASQYCEDLQQGVLLFLTDNIMGLMGVLVAGEERRDGATEAVEFY